MREREVREREREVREKEGEVRRRREKLETFETNFSQRRLSRSLDLTNVQIQQTLDRRRQVEDQL